MLVQVNIHAEDGHSFRVVEAPGPEEVRYLASLDMTMTMNLDLVPANAG